MSEGTQGEIDGIVTPNLYYSDPSLLYTNAMGYFLNYTRVEELYGK